MLNTFAFERDPARRTLPRQVGGGGLDVKSCEDRMSVKEAACGSCADVVAGRGPVDLGLRCYRADVVRIAYIFQAPPARLTVGTHPRDQQRNKYFKNMSNIHLPVQNCLSS